jgi:hypothetical protein
VLDHSGQVMVINGKASVLHDRASDPNANLERETPGVPFNEGMWESLEPYGCPGETMLYNWRAVTDGVADQFIEDDPKYAHLFRKSRDAWLAALAEVPAHV